MTNDNRDIILTTCHEKNKEMNINK